jgi:2-(1,2-epoxy-1,2-dihydrophenyl)acetyl-CoA isomerase
MELIITQANGVCHIKLNRPSVFNSFNQAMAMDLQRTLDECESNDEVRAIVITGEGKAFCAGQDLAEATDPNGPEMESIVREHYNPIIERIRNIEKPIIGAVNGVAAGAGANIALACDITFAAESASFIQAFFQNWTDPRFWRNVLFTTNYRNAESIGFDVYGRQSLSQRRRRHEHDLQGCKR